MRQRERGGLDHFRVCEQYLVDFLREDLFSAAVYHLLGAPPQVQVAVLVEETLVAGAEPAGREALLGRSVEVTAHHTGTPDDD